MRHKPVLLSETLELLNLREGDIAVDGTMGSAGHSVQMLEAVGRQGRLICLDQDPDSIERCRGIFSSDPRVSLHHENYVNLDTVMDSLNIPAVNAVLLDIGFSSDQIESPERGFSFDLDGPLDMRMNPEAEVTAADLIRVLSERELTDVFRSYGEERQASRFAKLICIEREKSPIQTTQDLVRVIQKALPAYFEAEKGKRPPWARRHPATQVFQALRIAVNQELEVLKEGLPRIFSRLKKGGRLVVISFHSLEDRIVKHQFLNWKQSGEGKILTKKPILAKIEEQRLNPRARSAKLRAVERV